MPEASSSSSSSPWDPALADHLHAAFREKPLWRVPDGPKFVQALSALLVAEEVPRFITHVEQRWGRDVCVVPVSPQTPAPSRSAVEWPAGDYQYDTSLVRFWRLP